MRRDFPLLTEEGVGWAKRARLFWACAINGAAVKTTKLQRRNHEKSFWDTRMLIFRMSLGGLTAETEEESFAWAWGYARLWATGIHVEGCRGIDKKRKGA